MSDTRNAGVERPGRRWRTWYLIPIGCLGLIGVIGAIFIFVFALTRPVVDGGDRFMTALKAGDYAQAYSLTAPSLQRELGGAKGLEARIGPYRPASWSWSSRSISNGIGEVNGSVTYDGGRTGTAQLTLSKSGDAWQVTAFRLN